MEHCGSERAEAARFDCRTEGDYRPSASKYHQAILDDRRAAYTVVFSVLLAPPVPPSSTESSDEVPQYLIAATSNGNISIFNLRALVGQEPGATRPVLHMQAHKGAVFTLSFVWKDGTPLLCSGGDDGFICAWRWAELEAVCAAGATKAAAAAAPAPVTKLRSEQTRGHYGAMGPIPEINSLAATASGEMVSGGGDGVCRVWDVVAGQQTTALHGHVDLIHSVASRSSHQQVVSGSEDGTVRVWDVRKGACTTAIDAWHGASVDVSSGVLGERSPWVGCVALDSLENWLACGSGGGAITLWSLTAGVATARMRTLAPPQTLLLPGDRIVAGGSEPYVTNWSLSGEPLQSTGCTPESVFALAVHPCGLTVVAGSSGGCIDIISELGCVIEQLHCT